MQRTKDTMFPLIEQWELSGQTQRDFVAEQGLTHSCFCYWRNRYLKEQHSSSGGFIPVHQPSTVGSGMVELIFPSGARAIFYQANAELIRSLVR